MAGVWTCNRNHRWRPNVTDSVTLDAVQPCPVCGEPGTIVDSESTGGPGDLATLTSGDGTRALPIEDVQIAGYDITAEIGRGAMGVVYRATESALNRPVALKMILAGTHAGSRDVARFRREVETVATLQHPNIVQIYAVGESGGLPYCALEYIEGGTLADRIRANSIEPREAARLTAKLARAVHYAHVKGVIHRDLKPSNVLLDAQGRPKIADFGLAKLGESSNLTASTAVLGTPAYMAPEQADGQTRTITPAADVYSLGAMLYEMLAGRPPFKAGSALETLHQVRNDDPPPIRRDNVNLPRDLETICFKCLEKDPSSRYDSANDLADDLDRFLAGESVHARPLSLGSRVVRWAKRRQAALTGAAIATAVTLLLVALWNRESPRDPGRSGAVPTNPSGEPVVINTTPPPDESELMVHVTTKNGKRSAPGSPYLERGVVLTSSDLLGMANKDSPPPEKIEVTYHTGRPEERTYAADVSNIDAALKIAILRVHFERSPDTPTAVASASPPPSPDNPWTRAFPKAPGDVASAAPANIKSTPSAVAAESSNTLPATVQLRSARPGAVVTGNGFFAGAPGIVVTAARAIGLSSNMPLPDTIEVIVDPGTSREQILPGRVLSVDWTNGVALLRADGKNLPTPLALKTNADFSENQQFISLVKPGAPQQDASGKTWIFEPLKTRTVRVLGQSSVGSIKLIQIETGSAAYGSPISDDAGQVLGMVAMGPQEGRNQFVVPAKAIEELLLGRLLSLLPGQPVLSGSQAVLPITGRLADPLARVSQLSFDVWAGETGRARQTVASSPVLLPSDNAIVKISAQLSGAADSPDGRFAESSLPIPPLKAGQVVWIRPNYRDANGKSRTGVAVSLGVPPPVVRSVAANLQFRPQGETRLAVQMRVPLRGEMRGLPMPEFTVVLAELASTIDGKFVDRVVCRDVLDQRGGMANKLIHSEGHPFLNTMCHQTILLDGTNEGAIKDVRVEAQHHGSAPSDDVEQLTQQTIDVLKALAVPLPGREMQPGETWKSAAPLTIGGATRRANGELAWNMTYRYIGRRPRNDREEAVIELSGQPIGAVIPPATTIVAPKDESKSIGSAQGWAIVDLASGRVIQARIRFDGSVPAQDGIARVFGHLSGSLARAEGAAGPTPTFDAKLLPPDMPIQVGLMAR